VPREQASPYGRCGCTCAGKYIGNRPIKLRRSTWKDRELQVKKGKGGAGKKGGRF